MDRQPKCLPCVTGKTFQFNFKEVLISPSQKNGITQEGTELTLIDCGTYRFKRGFFNKELARQHYRWYIDFVFKNKTNSTYVFIAPDMDWLKEDISQLTNLWKDLNTDAKCLIVPNTAISHIHKNIVGVAIPPNMPFQDHNMWVHCFSKYGNEKRYTIASKFTYDTTDEELW